MKQLTHLRHSDKFTNLIVSEIIKSLPWEVFLLNLLELTCCLSGYIYPEHGYIITLMGYIVNPFITLWGYISTMILPQRVISPKGLCIMP